jgi:hypothetical protein
VLPAGANLSVSTPPFLRTPLPTPSVNLPMNIVLLGAHVAPADSPFLFLSSLHLQLRGEVHEACKGLGGLILFLLSLPPHRARKSQQETPHEMRRTGVENSKVQVASRKKRRMTNKSRGLRLSMPPLFLSLPAVEPHQTPYRRLPLDN